MTRRLYDGLGVRSRPPVRVDIPARRVSVGDRRVHMTVLESKLLALLTRHPGEVVPMGDIFRGLYGADDRRFTKPARNVIRRLREKLDDLPEPRYITCVERVGYRVEPTLLAPACSPLDAYTVDVASGGLAMHCPNADCTADLMDGETSPVTVNRLREIVAWHELDHQAEAS